MRATCTSLGDNNAPELDAIAWYGGNSGVGFDLDNGMDSSATGRRNNIDHTRAGTRPVALKPPNRWGLHDMLGNVWEWCADHWHADYKGAPADGSALDRRRGAAAGRVLRGGSWRDGARVVRAAYRYGDDPASRDDDLGFRCARVQSDERAGGAERRAGRSKRGERSEPAATTGPPRSPTAAG